MKNRPFFRSVRYTMLFWNAGILSICLLGFCGLFHELLKDRLLSLVDTHLTERTNALVRLWRSIPQVAQDALREQLDAGRFGAQMFIPEEKSDAAVAESPRQDESLTGIYRPRAFTPDGKSYFRGINDSLLDASGFRTAVRGDGSAVHSTVTIHGNLVRVITVPVIVDGEVLFVLQSARDLGEYQAELQVVTTDLLRAIPFLLLLAAIGALILTDRAMRPVRQLRQATEHIEAQDLSQRLPQIGNDEFTLLTETLNHMLARLDTAFRQQAQFIADASHELRTPLTVLRGNTSLALKGERSAADYRSTIDRTHRTVESMSRLVDELLLLSRADSGQMLAATDDVCVNDAVRDAVDAESNGAISKGDRRSIHVACSAERLFVNGNSDLLVRLFANLLSNAIRHSTAEAPITVTVRREASQVLITVEDEGEGIAPEHMAHVMERFYRIDSARSGHQGSGLGLAICKSIVAAHHGSIKLTSRQGENSGTIVTVLLPLLPL